MDSLLRTTVLAALLALTAFAALAADSDRVCCRKDGIVQWGTRGTCVQSGGETATNKTCRKFAGQSERVCCKRRRSDWWSTTAECKKDGGTETANAECRDDNWNAPEDDAWNDYRGDWEAQLCCQRGQGASWASARACRSTGGSQTLNKTCRVM